MIETNNYAHGYDIADRAECRFDQTTDHVISRSRDGKLLGGIIFRGHTGASIAMHVASFAPRWINNNMLWIAFDYPFNQLKVKQVVGEIHSRNQRALDFDLKLGFKEVARIADIYPDGDLLIVSMRRDQCRWLKLKPRGA